MHPPVSEGPSPAEHRYRAFLVAVYTALEHHSVRFTDWTQCERFHPEIHKGREPVVDLR